MHVCSLSAALAKGVLNNRPQALRNPRLESVTSTACFLIRAVGSLRSNRREGHTMKIARAKEQKVVVVTGASAGVGRAVVREFASHGAAVGLVARGWDGLAATAQEVEKVGSRALIC